MRHLIRFQTYGFVNGLNGFMRTRVKYQLNVTKNKNKAMPNAVSAKIVPAMNNAKANAPNESVLRNRKNNQTAININNANCVSG